LIRPHETLKSLFPRIFDHLHYERYLYRERTVRSVTASTRRDVSEFLEDAAEIPVEPEIERFRFDQLPDALDRMNRSEHRASPVLHVRLDEPPD